MHYIDLFVERLLMWSLLLAGMAGIAHRASQVILSKGGALISAITGLTVYIGLHAWAYSANQLGADLLNPGVTATYGLLAAVLVALPMVVASRRRAAAQAWKGVSCT